VGRPVVDLDPSGDDLAAVWRAVRVGARSFADLELVPFP
jgi:DNA primase